MWWSGRWPHDRFKENAVSIEFTMRRIPALAYEQAIATGHITPDYLAESEEVAKDWDVLYRVLANGRPDSVAAAAIRGGVRMENEPDDYGGTRVLSPAEVARIAAELGALSEQDIEQRCRTIDFTGVYGEADGATEPPLNAFRALRDFYAEATKNGDAMAVWLG